MKARIPPLVSKRQQMVINKAYEQKADEERMNAICGYMQISMIVLNRLFGFGKKRLDRFVAGVDALSELSEEDEEYWTHVDMRLQQMGLDIEPEKED